MKVNVSFQELNRLVERKINMPISISYVNNKTVSVSYTHGNFIQTVEVNLVLDIPRKNYVALCLSSDTPGLFKIINGVLEFVKFRATQFPFLIINENTINVDLNIIPQLQSILNFASVFDFIADSNGITILLDI